LVEPGDVRAHDAKSRREADETREAAALDAALAHDQDPPA
jgi:hypothetical protein